jgi:hypothetical protein
MCSRFSIPLSLSLSLVHEFAHIFVLHNVWLRRFSVGYLTRALGKTLIQKTPFSPLYSILIFMP